MCLLDYPLDYSFKYWKFSVESIVYLLTGFKLDDLPDENYHINYENGMHICDMAKIILNQIVI